LTVTMGVSSVRVTMPPKSQPVKRLFPCTLSASR
jgi:hypothetical protein